MRRVVAAETGLPQLSQRRATVWRAAPTRPTTLPPTRFCAMATGRRPAIWTLLAGRRRDLRDPLRHHLQTPASATTRPEDRLPVASLTVRVRSGSG